MADELVVLDGSTFFVSNARGDVEGDEADGFFFADMRHLSSWLLMIDGARMRTLTSRAIHYYAGRVFGALATTRVGHNPTLTIQRDRLVADGVHEDVLLDNQSGEERRVRVDLLFAADFADLFEVKGKLTPGGKRWTEVDGQQVTLWYEREGFRRGTRLIFSLAGAIDEEAARFEVTLGPRARWALCIDIVCIVGDAERAPRVGHGGFGTLAPQMPRTVNQWLSDAPRLEADRGSLALTYHQSLVDLASLRFRSGNHVSWSLPAAGLPWFMALFGRDSLLTAYAALPFQPHLALSTLEALAEYQATERDDFRDAQPGKILHELRRGVLAALRVVPQSPYYGSHDATPLFLVLLDEYERWTGDVELVRRLEPAARAALAWIEGDGDPDRDGYLEYRTRSARGLVNQCWKDSWNSMLFADGRMAEPPIATCELQGYAYDARLRTARLSRTFWGDEALATRLERDAAALRIRFNRDYWSEERGHYVLALDGRKRQVDAMTSNVGHLLWSGIVDEDRAGAVGARLMAPDMFTGWGLRTMASTDAGYNAIEYHNGTVWPHDTAIGAEGLRRYGLRDEASRLALCLFDAAEAFAHQLPEVFAGLPRDETVIPVEYPTASRPQAWSAASPLLALRTLLGLDAVGEELRSAPRGTEATGHMGLCGVPFRGGRRDVG